MTEPNKNYDSEKSALNALGPDAIKIIENTSDVFNNRHSHHVFRNSPTKPPRDR
jgi:hypothetical protein